jgi:chemotaxis protein MotA
MTKKTFRLNYALLGGLAVAAAGILGGLTLEQGRLQDLAQITSLFIVAGGTIGAVLVSTSTAAVARALRSARMLFLEPVDDRPALLHRILHFATLARRQGVLSMEAEVERIEDPYLRKALLLAVDGVASHEIRNLLELEMQRQEDSGDADARVFEMAGGYAPTIGIIGAVLGLIQVMNHLDNVGDVGHGIAVAFVATLYGVGMANLLLLPAAAKIRARSQQQIRRCELIMQGVLAISEGLNPYLIRLRTEAFLDGEPAGQKRPAEAPATAPIPQGIGS